MANIQLANINEELTRLWDEAQGEKKTRASLFNLIIYAKKNKRVDYYQSLVKRVVSKFPCRLILIIGDDDSQEEYLKTEVQTETLGEGDLQIFCEIIRIEVAGALLERVYYILLPHLLCDLPTYLLWTQDPAIDNAILPRLESIASRIIFDPEETQNIQNYAQATLKLLKGFHCDIGDLNWSALLGWRNIFAELFDTPEAIDALEQSAKIQIVFAENPTLGLRHQEIEAAYLQAWLASTLHWKFKAFDESEGKSRLTYKRASGEVVILLSSEKNENYAPGSLLSVDIESAQNGAKWHFGRESQTNQICIQYSDQVRCDLPHYMHLQNIEEGAEIINEIFYPQRGSHYYQMLEVLTQIPWQNK